MRIAHLKHQSLKTNPQKTLSYYEDIPFLPHDRLNQFRQSHFLYNKSGIAYFQLRTLPLYILEDPDHPQNVQELFQVRDDYFQPSLVNDSTHYHMMKARR